MIFLKLFLTFFKIGLFTIGGGYAMIPLIQSEVLANGWLDLENLVNFIAVSESTPGPFAVNIATYIGAETGGFFGAVCATLGVVLPSFIIIIIIAKAYEKFKESKIVKGVMSGLKPCVVGLITAAVYSIGKTVFSFSSSADIPKIVLSLLIFLSMFFLSFKKKLHPVFVILISAAVGIIGGYVGIY